MLQDDIIWCYHYDTDVLGTATAATTFTTRTTDIATATIANSQDKHNENDGNKQEKDRSGCRNHQAAISEAQTDAERLQHYIK